MRDEAEQKLRWSSTRDVVLVVCNKGNSCGGSRVVPRSSRGDSEMRAAQGLKAFGATPKFPNNLPLIATLACGGTQRGAESSPLRVATNPDHSTRSARTLVMFSRGNALSARTWGTSARRAAVLAASMFPFCETCRVGVCVCETAHPTKAGVENIGPFSFFILGFSIFGIAYRLSSIQHCQHDQRRCQPMSRAAPLITFCGKLEKIHAHQPLKGLTGQDSFELRHCFLTDR